MSLPVAGMQETQAIIPHWKFEGHPSEVNDILYLRGGQQIMTCCCDGPLRVWDVDRGKQIGEDWGDEAANMNTIALSPDGKKIVGGGRDGAMRLWDIDTAKVIVKWMGHRKAVTSLHWNRDGQRVVSTGYYDDEVRVWDGETGDAILGPLKSGIMTEAVYSPDDTMIATGGRDSHRIGCINIWSANTGKPVANMNIRGPGLIDVTSIAWPRHGKTLISGLNDGKIVTWNTTTWQQMAVLTGHTGVVYSIAISPNDLILASVGTWDKTARLWDLENGQPIGSPLQHAKDARCLSFSPDGKGLATGCTHGNAYTWDVSAIVREAGRDELLPNPRDDGKLLLDTDAPRRPIQPLRNAHQLPSEFFDNSLGHPAFSGRRRLSFSARQHQAASGLASRGHTIFFLLFRRTHEGVGLQERRSTVVDVPLTQGQRRNASAGEIRYKREKEKNTKKASARPPRSSIAQQSGAAPLTHHLHNPMLLSSTSSTTPAVAGASAATMSTTSLPDVTIRKAGHWTRFWLRFCCTSAEYTDDHN